MSVPLVDATMIAEALGIAVLVCALLPTIPILLGALAVSLVGERLVSL